MPFRIAIHIHHHSLSIPLSISLPLTITGGLCSPWVQLLTVTQLGYYWWTVLSMWLIFLMLLLCLGCVAPMGVSLECTMWCFYGLNYAIACAYLTSVLASMIYLEATIRGLSLLVTNSLTIAHEILQRRKMQLCKLTLPPNHSGRWA
jgi:hypothetical protein